MHNHTDLEPCGTQCPVRWDPAASRGKDGEVFTLGIGWTSPPNYEKFASDPLTYGKGGEVRPTEEQERVARELRGFYVALREAGFDRDDAIATLGAIFDAKSRGEEFTL